MILINTIVNYFQGHKQLVLTDTNYYNYSLYDACKNRSIGPINKLLKRGYNNFNIALYGACEGGHMDLYYDLKQYFDTATFHYACLGGHLEIVQEIIKNKSLFSYDHGLFSACLGGSKELVDFLIANGAYGSNYWNEALKWAGKGGHIDLVYYMIYMGANNWNIALNGACEGGHYKIMQLMIARGANDWNKGLYGACRGGHLDIVQLMISLGANNWNIGLQFACMDCHKEIIKIMIDRGANNYNQCLWTLYKNFCMKGNRKYIQMIKLFHKKCNFQYMYYSDKSIEHYNCIYYLIKQGLIIDVPKNVYHNVLNYKIISIQVLPVNNDIDYLIKKL